MPTNGQEKTSRDLDTPESEFFWNPDSIPDRKYTTAEIKLFYQSLAIAGVIDGWLEVSYNRDS